MAAPPTPLSLVGRHHEWGRLSWFICVILVLVYCASSDLPRLQAQIAQKVGQDVIDALQAQGQAHVMIALAEPPSLRARVPNLPRIRNDIALLQNRVLNTVDASNYRQKQRYRAVPALAGTLLNDTGLAALAAHPDVVRIDLDAGGTGGLATSVPLIGADRWHARGITGNNVVVAVLDTGIDTDNDDLASGLIHQECFLDNDGLINGSGLCPNGSDRQSGAGAAEDGAGHGTHVSGIVASRGERSSVGVAPGAQIVSIKVLDNSSFSGSFTFFSEIVAALDFVINDRPDVRVINMSLGTFATFAGDCDTSTASNMAGAAAINTLRAKGVIAFASAGNNGSGTNMSSPACIKNVISVGATDKSNVVAAFSNSNASTDIMAPGVNIVSSAIGNGTTSASGTSMASPHAAGCAALFIQAGEATTPDQIETRLKSSPIQVVDPTNGLTFPRIDCSPRPPTTISMSGLAAGTTNTEYLFTASTSTPTATLPLDYTWQATDQGEVKQSAGLSTTVSFKWTTPGTKAITVQASNAGGVVSDTFTILISAVPPSTVAINGPTTGTLGNPYLFTAVTAPTSTTLPLTYTWQATELGTVTHSTGLSDTVSFNWTTPGTKSVTVQASNAGGVVSDTFTIRISAVPPAVVAISGPSAGATGTVLIFAATTSPATTSQPLSYIWEATDQNGITHSAGLSDTVSFNWATPGSKTVTVRASNVAGEVVGTFVINIERRIYLPSIIKQ